MDGMNLPPMEEVRPDRQMDTKSRDPSVTSSGAGADGAKNVAPGQGPPAPDPSFESTPKEEREQRGFSGKGQNVDEMGSLKPGEERVIDFPGREDRQLAIRLDRESGRPIFEIREKETGKVIRQIPSEEMRKLSKKLPEIVQGMLVDNTF